jgi:hypothetical protein
MPARPLDAIDFAPADRGAGIALRGEHDLDIANQLAQRVAGTTDPELAVEAVRGGAGRTTSTGLTGI